MIHLTKVAYRLSLPLLRLYIRHTRRVYAVITYKNQVLGVRLRFGDQTWTLPGGGKKRAEGWRAALTRELHEELGLMIDPEQLRFVADGRMQHDRLGYHYKLFALTLTQQPDLRRREFEILEAAFLPKDSQAYAQLRRSFDSVSVLE
jgi:ADP-ribose pyrophosphatase YjhB (NUDIX family)